MTQYSETSNYSAADHIEALLAHTAPRLIDCCVVNTAAVPLELLARYRVEQAAPVLVDRERLRQLGCEVIERSVISAQNYVRHDPDQLAKIIVEVVQNHHV